MAIQSERLEDLNGHPQRAGQFVLYWMQAAQRAQCNHALEYAIERANAQRLPLVVLFCLTDAFPEANARHYRFMLQGIRETEKTLAKRGLKLVVHHGHPEQAVPRAVRQAALMVTDAGHLRIQRQWRAAVASELACRMVAVETNLVVPVESVSDKENFSAGTLRPRMHRVWDRFLIPLRPVVPRHKSLDVTLPVKPFDLSHLDRAMARLDIDRTVRPVVDSVGGPSQALARLKEYVEHKLDHFADLRNDPSQDVCSGLSLYLNNKYEMDGRDPNGYAGVAWCFGQHDRAWGERPVYGKVRYMNANGLKRKFNIEAYVVKARGLGF